MKKNDKTKKMLKWTLGAIVLIIVVLYTYLLFTRG